MPVVRRRRNPTRGSRLLIGAGAVGLAGLAWYLFGDWVRFGASSGPTVEKVKGGEKAGGTWIKEDPLVLASTAGVNVDVYTLARIMRSEAGSGPEPERIAVAWVARNAARAGGKSVTAWATHATGASTGFYGPQNIQKRVVATGSAPRAKDLELAQGIMNGSIPDNTGGATHFLHPAGQTALAKMGLKGYTQSAETVIARWKASGLDPRKVEGAPRLLVFVPVGKPVLVAAKKSAPGGAS